MPTKRVEERFSLTTGRVDRTGTYPIIRDVLLCGSTSANGRDYPARAFAGDKIKRYEGKSVYFDHADKPGKSRKFTEKVAWIENARHNSAGLPIADIGVNPKHVDAETLLWAAENKKDFCGMSHVAQLRYSSKDGREVVEEVMEVFSVDIVADPATTGGFFEHKDSPMPKMKLSAFAEWVAKNPKSTSAQCLRAKMIAEDKGDAEMDAPADDADAGTAIDEAFKALLHAHMDEMIEGSTDVEDFCKKAKALYKAHKGSPKEAEGGEEKPKKKDEPPAESTIIGLDKAMTLCSEAKYSATPSEYRLFAKCSTEAEAKAFIAEQAAKGGEKPPRSSGRTQATPPKVETTQETRTIPAWNRVPSRS